MKYSLLQMTQDILSNLSSVEVNSISDNAESMQVATIIRQKYYDIINRLDLPDHEQLIQLQASTDATLPVLMYIPEGIASINWLKYFNSNTADNVLFTSNDNAINGIPVENNGETEVSPPGYEYVTIIPVKQFVDYINHFNPTNTNIHSYSFQDTSNGFKGSYNLYYRNDKTPQYCCVLSNYYVLFDSYDSSVDDTLQSSKTMAMGEVIPVFKMEDTFIPDLSEEQFQLLLNESKALAFFELKQQDHALANREVQRGWSAIQKKKSVVDKPSYFDQTPSFGRHGVYRWAGTPNSWKWR